jgi:hypothetical protein
MCFLLISTVLIALAVGLSWLNNSERPIRANWFPILLLVGQALIVDSLIDLQRSIGCPTDFGPCYAQHKDLSFLQDSKLLFAITSWLYWFYLLILILVSAFKWVKRLLVMR